MNPPRLRALLLALAFGPVWFARPSAAAPPAREPAALPVCTLFRDQNVVAAVPDGRGGEIVAWQDGRDGVHWVIFAQHVRRDRTLDPAWPVNGVAPAPVTLGQAYVTMVEDGAGGAIIGWQDAGMSYSGVLSAVKSQHVRADGTLDPRWPVGGQTLASTGAEQIYPALVSDGHGGAIAGWLERRGIVFELFAQHVRADGTLDPAWPATGLPVPGSPPQVSVDIVTDGAGGAILLWTEHVPNGQQQFMAQHVLADGTLDRRWPALGRPVSSVARDQQYALSVIADGGHGAIAAWTLVTPNSRQHVVVQHLPEDGAIDPAWSDTGRVVSHGVENQYEPILGSDERGGVYVGWDETPYTQTTRHLTHLSATGVIDPAWPTGGLLLGPPTGGGGVTNLLPDGKGGTLATCFIYDAGGGQSSVAQHVKATGRFDAAWPARGRQLIAPSSLVFLPAIVPDGEGGELAAWSARGVPAQGSDAFASAVRANGRPVRAGDTDMVDRAVAEAASPTADAAAPASTNLSLALASGNPATRATATVLRFMLPRAAHARLDVFDAAGRRIATVLDATLPAGPGECAWNGRDTAGRPVRAGLYFYRLDDGWNRITARGIKL